MQHLELSPDPSFPFAALTGLRTLHTLCLPIRLVEDAALPTGCWLSSLRRLAAPIPLLANSMEALAAASTLEYLAAWSFLDDATDTTTQLIGVIRWAAGRPMLRKLVLEKLEAGELPCDVVAAALEVQRQQPVLQIELQDAAHTELCNTFD